MQDGEIPAAVTASIDIPPADVLVEAGLMTDVPPCSCGRTVHRNCVHHSCRWIRIRRNLGKSHSMAARGRGRRSNTHEVQTDE